MNLQLLYNIKPQLEENLRNYFAAQGFNAFTRQNAPADFQMPRPRIETLVKVGQATGHRYISGGVYYNDTFAFELALRLVCDPENNEISNQELNNLTGTVRGMMQTIAQSTWADQINFPYHIIVEPLKDSSTDDTMQSDNNEEFCLLTFSGMVQIRTDAWNNT